MANLHNLHIDDMRTSYIQSLFDRPIPVLSSPGQMYCFSDLAEGLALAPEMPSRPAMFAESSPMLPSILHNVISHNWVSFRKGSGPGGQLLLPSESSHGFLQKS